MSTTLDGMRESVQAIVEVATALLEAVEASGSNGAPGGHLYAASMGLLSLDQFERIMGMLVKSGRIRKVGHVYYKV
jgi:hypothetical protein